MSDKVLSDEEIETLLEGVDTGRVDVAEDINDLGDVRDFNFDDQYNILLSKLPRLDKITETLIKELSSSLFKMLGIEAEVSQISSQTRKFGAFMRSLPDPININTLYIMPARYPAMVLMDTRLLYILVDQYYGGTGRTQGLEEVRGLSATELRLADQMLQHVLADLQAAWKSVIDLNFVQSGTEDSPANAHIMSAQDVIVESLFQICFQGNAGNIHIVLPYSFLESLALKLGATRQPADLEADPAWQKELAKEVNKVVVPVSSRIEGLQLTFEELVALSPGDVVAFKMPSMVSLNVEGVPIFKGTLGSSNGKNAVRVVEKADISEIR